jgi:hypothetical protein
MSSWSEWFHSWVVSNTTSVQQPVWKSSLFYANLNKIAAANAIQSTRELMLPSSEWTLLIFNTPSLDEGIEYWRQYRIDFDHFPVSLYEYLAIYSWNFQHDPIELKDQPLLLRQYQHALQNRVQLQANIRKRKTDQFSHLSVNLQDE